MEYNKLVRDNIVNIIRENGENPKFHILNDEELLAGLVAKIIEESKEILNCRTNTELVEEIGDLLEVILSIMKLKKINFSDLSYSISNNFISDAQLLNNQMLSSMNQLIDKSDISLSELATFIKYALSFVKIYHLDMKLIEKLMIEKSSKKGRFEKGIYLESVEKTK